MALALPPLEELEAEWQDDARPRLPARRPRDSAGEPDVGVVPSCLVPSQPLASSGPSSSFYVPGSSRVNDAAPQRTFQPLSQLRGRSLSGRIVPHAQPIGKALRPSREGGDADDQLTSSDGGLVLLAPPGPTPEAPPPSGGAPPAPLEPRPPGPHRGWLDCGFFSSATASAAAAADAALSAPEPPEAEPQHPTAPECPTANIPDPFVEPPTERQRHRAQVRPIDARDIHNICSGQVILSLASACKELIENSIDAGATNVEVRLREYGLEGLEVTDDGSGVDEANYEALVLKHHTSKIQCFEDLGGLETFGFRGEALSSLCAMCGVNITTRTKEQTVGVRLCYDHNQRLVSRNPVPHNVGTTVSLSQLFDTLPVRRREFAKGIKKEYSQLLRLLQQYAVGHPRLRFHCVNHTKGGKSTVLNTKRDSTMLENICSVFGSKVVKVIVPFHAVCEQAGFVLDGFVSKLEIGSGRGSTDMQFCYVNRRPVDLPKLAKLINQLFRRYNSGSQYPIFFLNIDTKTNQYDINVTPDKRKVFLHDEEAMLDFVQEQLTAVWEPSRYTFARTQTLMDAMPLGTQTRTVRQCSHMSAASVKTEVMEEGTVEMEDEVGEGAGDSLTDGSADRLGSSLSLAHSTESLGVPELEEEERAESPTNVRQATKALVSGKGSVAMDSVPPTDPLPDAAGLTASLGATVAPLDGGTQEEADFSTAASKVDDKCQSRHQVPLPAQPAPGRAFVSRRTGRTVAVPIPILSGLPATLPARTDSQAKGRGSACRFIDDQCKCSDDGDSDPEAPSDGDAAFIDDATAGADDPGDHLRLLNAQRRPRRGSKRTSPEAGITEVDRSDSEVDIEVDGAMPDAEEQKRYTGTSIQIGMHCLRSYLRAPNYLPVLGEPKIERTPTTAQDGGFGCRMNRHSNAECERELSRRIEKRHFTEMAVVGQFNEGFIITLLNDDLFIIDQHAADEKYNFEELHRTTVITSQPLVVAKPSGLGAADEVIIEENLDIFQANGFHFVPNDRKDLDPENPNMQSRLLIASLPVSKQVTFTEQDIQEMVCLLRERPGVMCRPSKVSAMLASRACRKSVMVGRALDDRQMTTIVRHLSAMDQPWNCPHGRPTMRHLVTLEMGGGGGPSPAPPAGLYTAPPSLHTLGLGAPSGPPLKRSRSGDPPASQSV